MNSSDTVEIVKIPGWDTKCDRCKDKLYLVELHDRRLCGDCLISWRVFRSQAFRAFMGETATPQETEQFYDEIKRPFPHDPDEREA